MFADWFGCGPIRLQGFIEGFLLVCFSGSPPVSTVGTIDGQRWPSTNTTKAAYSTNLCRFKTAMKTFIASILGKELESWHLSLLTTVSPLVIQHSYTYQS